MKPARVTLGCIGDDYTGSSDLANALTRAGLRTIQTIGVPGDDLALPDVDAVVIALKSRSVPAGEAVAMTRPALTWLQSRGARHVMFKICSTFDSTDRGNIGPVMDALRAAAGAPLVLVNSAFPETRRTIYRGNLFVGDVPLNESPLKDHPLNPMHDANLVRVLGRQSRARIGLIGLEDVEAGLGAIESRIQALTATGLGAAIVDCVLDRELVQIGRAALTMPLSVGASGLGIGLARAMVEQGLVIGSATQQSPPPVGGPIAMLSGSCSQATLGQVAAAERWAQVLRLDAQKLIADPGETQRVIDWATSRLGGAPILIASSAPPDAVLALQARHGVESAGRAIEAAMATIAKALAAAGVRRLVVAGGETSGAVVNTLGHRAFSIGAEIAPGVPVLRTIGTGNPEMVLALKSGNFGAESFFADAVRLMP
jgi:3-dehydrotetronate 4-kinase